jgi:hypothetical protein
MDAFEAFTLYHVMKLHFTAPYDGFKYGWKSNITAEKFMQRKDRMFFFRIAKEIQRSRRIP